MICYIHIPFCDSKCFYCAFNSFANISHLKNQYFKSLLLQLKNDLNIFNVKKLKTLYIGGGTPSSIMAQEFEPIFATLFPFLEKNAEITIEANPNSADKKWLKEIKSFGVNRISFGVQSFNDKKLSFLGRAHNAKMAKEAIFNAKNIGFSNISVDIIYDTPFDTKDFLKKEFHHLKNLPINHLSLYSLTIEKNTPFFKQNIKQNILDPKTIVSFAKELGFMQYEVANFGKNYQSIHNLSYWKYDEYLGIGCGAVGRIKNKRYYPLQNIKNYISNPLQKKAEILSQDDIITEKLLLGLRSNVGVDINLIKTNINYQS